jgi:cytoskeletal protein CcmA (bactofilin family)
MWGRKKPEPVMDDVFSSAAAQATRVEPVAVPAPLKVRSGSIIAAGTVVNGSIAASGDVQIDGTVHGDVRASALTIGAEGAIVGNVAAETATIRGKVSGDVRARTIQLASKGAIEGDLTHAVLIIEEGGVFEGRSRRSADPLAEEAPQLESRPASADAKAEAKAEEPKAEAPVVAKADEAATSQDEPRSSLADALGDAFAEKV